MNQHVRAVRILIVSLVVPALVTIAALAVTFSLARTAASVAVHWNAAGQVDGYGSPYTYPILLAVIVLPLVAIFGGIVVVATHRGPVTATIKLLGVLPLWLSVGLGGAFTGLIAVQTGGAPSTSLAPLPIGIGVGTIIAAGAWFIPPKVEQRTSTPGIPVAPVQLGATERASWIRSASASGPILWGLIALTVLLAGVAVISAITSGGGLWWVAFVPLVVLVLALSNLAWTVRVDARGVRVRSLVGVPTFHIPLADIRSAGVVEVHPLTDFGGWGVRVGLNGRLGIVMRTGEALEVIKTSGRSIVVTVDDAASAAALLNGLVKQQAPAVS
jgi:hypothetical protein